MTREHLITFRHARLDDVSAIMQLVNGYAAQAIMLYRSRESIVMALHDFVVAVDEAGTVLACGALREYSPSLAEVASVAVAQEAHGRKLGAGIVQRVEALARKRGIQELFALTSTAAFFEHCGYHQVDRALYPEKIRRDCLQCPRRIRCGEVCVSRTLAGEVALAA